MAGRRRRVVIVVLVVELVVVELVERERGERQRARMLVLRASKGGIVGVLRWVEDVLPVGKGIDG
jgi:hypothetical protein